MSDIETPGPPPPDSGGGDKGREGGNRRRRFRGRRRRSSPNAEETRPAGEAVAEDAASAEPAGGRPAGDSQVREGREDGGERQRGRRGGRREAGRREGGNRDAGGREDGNRERGGNREVRQRQGEGGGGGQRQGTGGGGHRGESRGRPQGQRGDRGPRDVHRVSGDRADVHRGGGNRGGVGRTGRAPRSTGPGVGRGGDRPAPSRGDVPPLPPTLRVLLAGGGTGGHIYPALAVADEITRRNKESRVLFVGTRTGLESKLVPEAGYPMTTVEVSGFAGRGPLARIRSLFQLVSATFRMRSVIREFAPELVVGTGGYVSGPAVLAARWAGIPTIIQEQNSIPGQMNRLLARFVTEIHVAFTESRLHFKQTEKIRLSGNPTRIKQLRGSLTELHRRWGLDPARKTVLVVGGSRGARSLNEAMITMLPQFAGDRSIQFIVQTGEADEVRVREVLAGIDVQAVVRPYLSPIAEAYALATMVVCRAGAMTLAEISQFGLPAILIPFPHAIYQHQLMNARILAEKDAAELMLDQDLTGPALAERIRVLLGDQLRRRTLGRNVWNLARPDAHERIVTSIEQLTHPVAAKQPVDWVSGDEETEAVLKGA